MSASMKLCGFDVGLEHPLFLIAGPCVVESEPAEAIAMMRFPSSPNTRSLR